MKKGLLFIFFNILFCHNFSVHASSNLPEMKEKAKKAISICEKSYEYVKRQGQRLKIGNLKKPIFLISKSAKEAYDQKVKLREKYQKVFKLRFSEFSEFTNEKIKIRVEKDASKLQDSVTAYSSNCARFSKGLVQFVDWAVSGKSVDKVTETVFND